MGEHMGCIGMEHIIIDVGGGQISFNGGTHVTVIISLMRGGGTHITDISLMGELHMVHQFLMFPTNHAVRNGRGLWSGGGVAQMMNTHTHTHF